MSTSLRLLRPRPWCEVLVAVALGMAVPTGIGPIGRLARSPSPGPGRIVGLQALTGAAEIVPAGFAVRDALRGFNDAPEGRIVGSSGGRLTVTRPDLGEEPFSTPGEEEAFAAAK